MSSGRPGLQYLEVCRRRSGRTSVDEGLDEAFEDPLS